MSGGFLTAVNGVIVIPYQPSDECTLIIVTGIYLTIYYLPN